MKFSRIVDIWLIFWNWCLVKILKMKFDQDLYKNSWYDQKKLTLVNWIQPSLESFVPLAIFFLADFRITSQSPFPPACRERIYKALFYYLSYEVSRIFFLHLIILLNDTKENQWKLIFREQICRHGICPKIYTAGFSG